MRVNGKNYTAQWQRVRQSLITQAEKAGTQDRLLTIYKRLMILVEHNRRINAANGHINNTPVMSFESFKERLKK